MKSFQYSIEKRPMMLDPICLSDITSRYNSGGWRLHSIIPNYSYLKDQTEGLVMLECTLLIFEKEIDAT